MNQSPSKNCPKPALLIEFLQGKLQPPTLDECEAHLENCPQCHETLRGLDTGDTLSEKVTAALIADQPDQDSDSMQVDGLIKRLTSSEFQTRSPASGQAATSEIMADRAAEVLRCVEPDDETLGVIGDYALLRLIGSGSTGVVFQALDRKLQRTVALKVLRPSLGVLARERFLAEARSAASIEHPNVVTIFQVGQVDRLAFIAMQWSPGQTLESKLQSGACFDESQVTDIISKVARGLAAAHQHQVVHRDIKPANLWVCDSDDQIKILDFGLARISDDNPGLTATGMLAGTPNFMSPEQARGLELDGRSDLFSLGCLMYQLLTGRLPFGAPTVLATLQSVQNQSPTPPHQIKPDVPQHLSDLTMCLLEKQPTNRPESAHQLIEMLSTTREDWPIAVNQYLGTPEEETAVAHAIGGETQRQSGGMRWLMAGLLLGLAGWGAWLWAPQILRVMTDQGEVVIESKADDVEVQVFADGKLIRVVDTQTQQSFDLKSGKYTFAARSSGDEKNTFTISPNQLTMSRGSTQIVKIATPDDIESSLQMKDMQTGETKTSEAPYHQAVYDGHTFEHWISVARYDHSRNVSDQALYAASKIAASKTQKAEVIQAIVHILRQFEPQSIPPQNTGRLNMSSSNKIELVLNRMSIEEKLKFTETEIKNGTSGSRSFLTRWIYHNNGYWKPISIRQAVWCEEVINNSPRFFALAAANVEQAGNESLADAFVWLASENDMQEEVVKKAYELGFAQRLEKQLVEGDLSLRLEKLPVATILFPANETIYDLYEGDFFDDETSRKDREFIISSFICSEQLMPRLSHKRALTLLKDETGKSFRTLIELRPFLSKEFIRDELEPKLEGIDLMKFITPAERDQLLPAGKNIEKPDNESPKSLGVTRRGRRRPASDKPVFKNQTFDHWLRVAQRDRDAATRSGALKACAAIAETEAEVESMTELTRKLCRKYGSDVIGNDHEQDLYLASMLQALTSLEVNQIVNFIETEIAEGTEASRRFCFSWLIRLHQGVIPKDWTSKKNSVVKQADQLGKVLASHLDKPGNARVLEGLQYGFDKKKFKKTALAKALKQAAAKPDQRLLLHRSIFRLLGDDTEVFQLFREDLLNPKTDPETRQKFFNWMPFGNNQQHPLPRQWMQLLFDVADGVLRQGEQRLEFARDLRGGGGGGFPVGSRVRAEEVLIEVLRSLKRLEVQLEVKFKTETLLPQLKILKMAVEKAANDPKRTDDFLPEVAKVLLADFDYMIKVASGDSEAETPESGFLNAIDYPGSGGGGFGGGGVF